jgi:CheY-like chemotaxis protein/two-component sensor histidine kinase
MAENPDAEDAGRETVELLDDAVATARTLTSHLSPPVLRDAGFVAALNWLASECNRLHHLDVDVRIDNRTEPGSATLALFLVDATRELLFNVAKHAETDTAQLRLCREEDMVRITVRDEGKGFGADEMAKAGDDLGFGLVGIARRVELLGGELDVESVPGDGCRATLSLPTEVFDRRSAPLKSLRAYGEKAREVHGEAEPLRVLIVVDHEMMRDGLAQMLASEEGLEVVGKAADGEEGVGMAEGLEPDVILMDIGMEPMNGIEATRIIREQHPDIRIVGVSVHEEGELSQQMLDAGARAFVTKGAPIEELLAAIQGDGDTEED